MSKKRKKKTRNSAMAAGGKVKCLACTCEWPTRDAADADHIKCGKNNCPLLSQAEKDALISNKMNQVQGSISVNWPWKEKKFHGRDKKQPHVKEPEIITHQAEVPDKYVQKEGVTCYFEEVPKVIVTSMRMK